MRAPSDRPRLVPALERATYRAEAPIRKVVRSHRLNPLPHAGTISVFLLGVVKFCISDRFKCCFWPRKFLDLLDT